MKKIVSLLLAFGILFLTAACAKPADVPAEQTAVTTAETEQILYIDTLPQSNFEGQTYVIAGMVDYYKLTDYTELNGEPVNDAVFTQYANTEEKLNVKIEKANLTNSQITASIQADENAFATIVFQLVDFAKLFVLPGYVVNLYDIEGLDLTQPWWNQSVVNELTIYDKLFMAFGDYIPDHGITYTHNFYFNKNLAESYNMPDFYGLVRSGQWTFDNMAEVIKTIYTDLNGNSERDFEDLYGLGQSVAVSGVYKVAFDYPPMARDENNLPYLNLNTEKFADIVSRVKTFCYENPSVLTGAHADENKIRDMFINSQLLLYSGFLCNAPELRDMKDDFGILPFPKWDEAQTNYYTTVRGDNYFMGIPISVPKEDYDFVGLTTEVIAYYGYTLVHPATYETTLKAKLTRDDDSIEMIDLLSSGIYIDYEFAHSDDKGFMFVLWRVLEGKKDWASYYAGKEKTALKYYDGILEMYAGLK
ncbi:MAG: hypothetical protein ACYCWE_08885 [Eubacteriales bacterium]